MSAAFWRDFWEGMNPLWHTVWVLYWAGHLVSLPLNRWDACAWLYPLYNRLMCWSVALQQRYRLSGPWRPR